MYIKELWNLPITSILIDLFTSLAAIFFTAHFMLQYGAAMDNQTDHNSFFAPMPLI
jgi:hypothetical protein